MLREMTRAWTLASAAMLSLAACKEPRKAASAAGAKTVGVAATGSGGAAQTPRKPPEIEPTSDPRKPSAGAKRPRVEGEEDCRKSPDACVRRAVTLTRTDLARAAALFGFACEEGNAPGCGNLAVMLRDGRGIAQDRSRAEKLMKIACDDGHGPSCENAKALAQNR